MKEETTVGYPHFTADCDGHKIDLADRVLVLDVDGYIGESTRSEIEYAQQIGRPISYLSERAVSA